MTLQEDIDSIQRRLVEAESDCEGWRMTKLQEKYLEACSTVEALQSQLHERLRQQRAPEPGMPGPGPG
jgi:hypothetical protein